MATKVGRETSMLRHHEFRQLWIGETTSLIGTAMSGLALPLVAISLGAGPLGVALLEALLWLPWLLLALPAGALLDRHRKRPVMVVCDIAGFAAMMSVPLVAAFDLLTFQQLLAVATISGIRSVFFESAYGTYLTVLVDGADLPRANSMLRGSESVAAISGPGLAGAIASLAGVVAGVAIDAATFLVSAVFLTRIRTVEPPAPPLANRPNLVAEIKEGLRFVGRDRWLVVLAATAGLQNMALTGVGALQVIFLVRTIGIASASAGTLMAVVGAGGILGAAISARVADRLGTGRTILLCSCSSAALATLVPLAGPGPRLLLYILGTALPTAAVVVWSVVVASFIQRYCPRSMLGRVITTTRMVAFAAAPLGAAAAGALAAALSVRAALWLLTVPPFVAAGLLMASPVRTSRDLPTTYRPSAQERPGGVGDVGDVDDVVPVPGAAP